MKHKFAMIKISKEIAETLFNSNLCEVFILYEDKREGKSESVIENKDEFEGNENFGIDGEIFNTYN